MLQKVFFTLLVIGGTADFQAEVLDARVEHTFYTELHP